METTLENEIHQKHELFSKTITFLKSDHISALHKIQRPKNKRLSLPIMQWSKGDF